MSFKVGEKVAVIDEDLKGVIIEIKGNVVIFETDFGFLETYPISKLVQQTLSLDETDPIQIKEDDLKKAKPKEKNLKKEDFLEVDLHIGHLVDYPKQLSNFEMLTIQLETAENIIETAIQNNAPKRIVFIHGYGQGVLKKELYKLLDLYSKKCHYFDASFRRYRQGATEVNFF